MSSCWSQVGGYRDLMLCAVLEGPNGLNIVGEIQVINPSMFLAYCLVPDLRDIV